MDKINYQRLKLSAKELDDWLWCSFLLEREAMKNSKLSLISDLVFVWWLPAVLLCTRLLSWPFGFRSFKQPLRYCMIETQKSIQGIQGTTKPSYLDTQCGNSCYFTFWLWYSCYFLVRQKVPYIGWKWKEKHMHLCFTNKSTPYFYYWSWTNNEADDLVVLHWFSPLFRSSDLHLGYKQRSS